MIQPRLLIFCGAALGFLAVALGAFGAHALANTLTPKLQTTYQTAVDYHGLHSAALLLVGILAQQYPGNSWLRRAGWLMLLGILLFSGSLYLLAVTGLRPLGWVTPFGGVTLLAAWLALAAGALRLPRAV